mmetsp:Transcript_17844/g.41202  ORF Transcript_17844/g.41202 Transcript_17844/m.41202 type:complete len:251 (-) Transcript_17844:116-868(-)
MSRYFGLSANTISISVANRKHTNPIATAVHNKVLVESARPRINNHISLNCGTYFTTRAKRRRRRARRIVTARNRLASNPPSRKGWTTQTSSTPVTQTRRASKRFRGSETKYRQPRARRWTKNSIRKTNVKRCSATSNKDRGQPSLSAPFPRKRIESLLGHLSISTPIARQFSKITMPTAESKNGLLTKAISFWSHLWNCASLSASCSGLLFLQPVRNTSFFSGMADCLSFVTGTSVPSSAFLCLARWRAS